jgi:hypothetical protein
MSDETNELPIEVEAQLELEPKPEVRRGLASLRGVRRSTYMRRSLLRILSMAPEELAAFEPRNGFEFAAKMLITKMGTKEGALAVTVWRCIAETLAEGRGKDAVEEERAMPTIINDMPSKNYN